MFIKVQTWSTLMATWVLLLSSCALDLNIGTGSSTPADVRPPGIPISTGTLQGLSGNYTATGNVYIFFQNGSYILRLEGLSVPNESGLNIRLLSTSGTLVTRPTLRAISGNQNYTFTATLGTQFGTVYISNSTTNTDYASATLSSKTTP